jgi:hypothetical protein
MSREILLFWKKYSLNEGATLQMFVFSAVDVATLLFLFVVAAAATK